MTTAAVSEQVVSKFLVRISPLKLTDYRRSIEQRSEYWSREKLERSHWNILYDQVSLIGGTARAHYGSSGKRLRELERVRTALCDSAGIAKDFVLIATLSDFFTRHQMHARLCIDILQ